MKFEIQATQTGKTLKLLAMLLVRNLDKESRDRFVKERSGNDLKNDLLRLQLCLAGVNLNKGS